jgi:hypothetical protein
MVLAPPVMRFDDIAERGAEDARKIDAPVFFKMLVFDGGTEL